MCRVSCIGNEFIAQTVKLRQFRQNGLNQFSNEKKTRYGEDALCCRVKKRRMRRTKKTSVRTAAKIAKKEGGEAKEKKNKNKSKIKKHKKNNKKNKKTNRKK